MFLGAIIQCRNVSEWFKIVWLGWFYTYKTFFMFQHMAFLVTSKRLLICTLVRHEWGLSVVHTQQIISFNGHGHVGCLGPHSGLFASHFQIVNKTLSCSYRKMATLCISMKGFLFQILSWGNTWGMIFEVRPGDCTVWTYCPNI